jgi:threonine/homoserine/homoserine lactone efflux protein
MSCASDDSLIYSAFPSLDQMKAAMSGSFLVFLGVAVVVIITPGPDTAMTVRNALLGGRVAGIFTALGIATGQTMWALAASAGLVALVVASQPLFVAVKYAGAAYLMFLGVEALIGALRPGALAACGRDTGLATRLTKSSAYRQGILSNLANPKMALFFASILPQFASDGSSFIAGPALLGLTFSFLTFVWLAGYAIAVAAAGRSMRPKLRRTIEALSGTILIALGLRIAMERR